MADKELTVFVVEAGLPSDAYHYVYDVLALKLLKGLKTDYVSVVAFKSSVTSNALEHTGKFRGINVLADFETPSYNQLQSVKAHLDNSGTPESDASDAFQSLIFSVSLFEKTKKKAFTRNIVLVTSAGSSLDSYTEEKARGIPNLVKDLNIKLVVIGAGFGGHSETEQNWQNIAEQFASHHILNTKEAKDVSQLHPPVRKTRPLSIYKGELRLGADISKVLHDPSYVAEHDSLCLAFRVEVYPAAKSEVLSQGGHEYLIDNGNVVRVERKTNHFIWKKNFQGEREEHLENDEVDDKKFDKVSVDGNTFTPGFKFSNYDLIALDEDLMSAAKLEVTSEFDILGFVAADSIPYAYFTDEAFFVVPEKGSSQRNLLNHTAFAEALYDKGIAPLARFVRKQAKEVDVGPLFPVKVKMGHSFTFGYMFVRLPYKEDEKIGHFPSLSEETVKDDTDVKEASDASALNKSMEEFIESKTYSGEDEMDDTRDYKTVIDNFKVTLKASDSSKLPLPPNSKHDDKFLCSSPGANKFAVYLRKILIKCLLERDLSSFADDPKFLQKFVREDDPKFTNLLNLENSLAVNSATTSQDWLSKILDSSSKSSKRLLSELEVKYVRKADLKKQKTKKGSMVLQARGNYGADEGNYDEVPDFGL